MAEPTPQGVQEKLERLTLESYAETHKREAPGVNEDALISDDTLRLYAVFDGMGGHEAGERASAEAVKAVRESVAQWDDIVDEDVPDLPDSLGNSLIHAHRAVLGAAEGTNMGTTASAVKLYERHDGTVVAAVSCVGDSPAYVWRAETKTLELLGGTDDILSGGEDYIRLVLGIGPGEQLPSDEELERIRWEVRNSVTEDALSPRAKELWKRRYVVGQNLGMEEGELQPRNRLVELRKGDKLLLLTDGITDFISEQDIAVAAVGTKTPKELANILMSGALATSRDKKYFRTQGKNPDDMTAVVIQVS